MKTDIVPLLTTCGLDVNNPKKRYRLKSLPVITADCNYSEWNMSTSNRTLQGQDIGFDLSAEYRIALSMFGINGKEKLVCLKTKTALFGLESAVLLLVVIFLIQ